MMTGMGGSISSPTLSGISGVPPVEADLQPHAILRSHEFKCGRRVFHVHFGHGFVRSLEAEPTKADPASDGAPAQTPEPQRVLSQKTHNINVHFDNPKYSRPQRLRAFYAVPKMVVIPSSAALRKQKLLHAVESTPDLEVRRLGLVRSLVAVGSVRAACSLIHRWKLQSQFEPTALLEQLLHHRCYSAAMRFARDFACADTHPPHDILRRMLEDRQYDAALKHVSKTCDLVDGERSPSDVLQLLVGAGHHALALKYVHKFGAESAFPPSGLVNSILHTEGELSVRTCGMLLKYVRLYQLEASFPIEQILERISASGVTVHEMDGKYVLKGRRRSNISQPHASGSGPSSQLVTPGTSPPAPLSSSAPQ